MGQQYQKATRAAIFHKGVDNVLSKKVICQDYLSFFFIIHAVDTVSAPELRAPLTGERPPTYSP
jgi:hypothetical protein